MSYLRYLCLFAYSECPTHIALCFLFCLSSSCVSNVVSSSGLSILDCSIGFLECLFKQWWPAIPLISSKRTITFNLKPLKTWKTMTYGVGNPGTGLDQTYKCCDFYTRSCDFRKQRFSHVLKRTCSSSSWTVSKWPVQVNVCHSKYELSYLWHCFIGCS